MFKPFLLYEACIIIISMHTPHTHTGNAHTIQTGTPKAQAYSVPEQEHIPEMENFSCATK